MRKTSLHLAARKRNRDLRHVGQRASRFRVGQGAEEAGVREDNPSTGSRHPSGENKGKRHPPEDADGSLYVFPAPVSSSVLILRVIARPIPAGRSRGKERRAARMRGYGA